MLEAFSLDYQPDQRSFLDSLLGSQNIKNTYSPSFSNKADSLGDNSFAQYLEGLLKISQEDMGGDFEVRPFEVSEVRHSDKNSQELESEKEAEKIDALERPENKKKLEENRDRERDGEKSVYGAEQGKKDFSVIRPQEGKNLDKKKSLDALSSKDLDSRRLPEKAKDELGIDASEGKNRSRGSAKKQIEGREDRDDFKQKNIEEKSRNLDSKEKNEKSSKNAERAGREQRGEGPAKQVEEMHSLGAEAGKKVSTERGKGRRSERQGPEGAGLRLEKKGRERAGRAGDGPSEKKASRFELRIKDLRRERLKGKTEGAEKSRSGDLEGKAEKEGISRLNSSTSTALSSAAKDGRNDGANADIVIRLDKGLFGSDMTGTASLSGQRGTAAPSGFANALAQELRNQYNGDIVRHASIVVKDGGEGLIRLALQPAQLGNVKVRLAIADNKVAAKIIVKSEEALKAFESELVSLKEAFLEGGFEGADIEIALASDGSAESGTGGERGQKGAEPYYSARLSARETSLGYESHAAFEREERRVNVFI